MTESLVRIPQRFPEAGVTWRERVHEFRTDIVSGFSMIWSTRGLRTLVIVSTMLSFVTAAVLVTIPFYVSDQLQQKEDWVGFLSAAYGTGALVGYLSAGIKEFRGTTRATLLAGSMLLESLVTLSLGLVSGAPVALVVVFVGGMFGGFTAIYVMTIVQTTTPSEARGRMFGFLGSISASLAPLGMGAGGFVFDAIGQNIPLMYLSCGTLMVVLVLSLIVSKDVRTFLATDISTSLDPTLSTSTQAEAV
jgi:MFS family permease